MLGNGGVGGVVYGTVGLVDGWVLLMDVCRQGQGSIVALASPNLQ